MKSLPYLPVLVPLCLITFSALPVFAAHGNGGPGAAAASISASDPSPSSPTAEFQIPGPLRSFLRMAGISQEISPQDVLPLLAWNVSTIGYQGGNRQSEFLILLTRYFSQARELQALAGSAGVIRVTGCGDAAPLLQILGYRTTSDCGKPNSALLTGNAERAFLTIDSGFPLTELEQSLQGGKPFEYSFAPTPVPALFTENEWNQPSRRNHRQDTRDLVDAILVDRSAARLYWALSKMDPETVSYLRRSLAIPKLLDYGAALDFYGTHLCIRHGRVLVPGGAQAESAWEELAGASPSAPAEFIPALMSKDDSWLAAYFDVLSSVHGKQQAYFTQPHRLRRFYAALRSVSQRPGATAGVFRPAPWLLLLVSRTQFGASGEPLVPGGIEVWRELLARWKEPSHEMREREKRNVKNSQELMEAMFAVSRDTWESGPLQAYLALSELDSRRSPGHHLTPETVRTMCLKFADFSDQYRIFSEFPELSDASILLFLDTADRLGKLHHPVRGDAFGIIQANLGIWQILARQQEIASSQLDDSWQALIKPFAAVHSSSEVYEAGRKSLGQLFHSAIGSADITQDGIVDLLAGPRQATPEGKSVHRELANRIRSVLDGQRLVSLDTLIALGNALSEKENGKLPAEYELYLANELHEFQMPQPIFTNSERIEWAPTMYNNHHTDLEMRTNVGGVLKSAKVSHPQVEEARGQLTPFLRDILVGLNYAYYEPPGAQALHNNPLFVRSHDFAGETVEGIEAIWQAPQLFGAGYPAGGGAHFVGSLADLPYELAELEQDFIAPKHVQALIWQELVPSLLTSAVLARWWNVHPVEMHAVALYQRSGEELLAASAHDAQLRGRVMAILSERVLPRRLQQIEGAVKTLPASEFLKIMTPADTFYLAAEFESRYPEETGSWGTAGEELRALQRQHPEEVNWQRLSQDFGVPHPALNHTYARELLNVPPLPAFSGFASRLLAESWDSSILYWARLADETGASPVELNRLVPQLTREMVERVFATDLEDWPAILRALRETGEDFRNGKVASLTGMDEPHP
jgi:hypothetical protein